MNSFRQHLTRIICSKRKTKHFKKYYFHLEDTTFLCPHPSVQACLHRWGLCHLQHCVYSPRVAGSQCFLHATASTQQWEVRTFAHTKGKQTLHRKQLQSCRKSKLEKMVKSEVPNTHLGKRWAWGELLPVDTLNLSQASTWTTEFPPYTCSCVCTELKLNILLAASS